MEKLENEISQLDLLLESKTIFDFMASRNNDTNDSPMQDTMSFDSIKSTKENENKA